MFKPHSLKINLLIAYFLVNASIGNAQSQFNINNTSSLSCSGTLVEGNLQGSFSLTRIDQNGFNTTVSFNQGTFSGITAKNNWVLGNGPPPNFNGIDMFEYNLSATATYPSLVEAITIKRMVDNAGGTAELADFTVTWQGCGQGMVVDPDDQIQNYANGDFINSGDTLLFRPGSTSSANAANTWEIVVYTSNITIKVEGASMVSSQDMLYNEWISFEVDLKDVETNFIQTCSGSDMSSTGFILPPTGTFTWDNTNSDIGLPDSGSNATLDFSATNTGSTPITGEISISTCLGIYSVSTITVNPIPQIEAGQDVIACEDSLIVLNASSNATYSWDSGIIDGIGFQPPQGITEYIAMAENSFNCTNMDTVVVTIQQIPWFELFPNEYFVCNEQIELELPPTGAVYHWNNISSTSTMVFDTPGQYIITATDNSICTASDTLTIHESCDPSIVIPNVFTPNNDGINDFYKITGNDISQFQINIFNRWGLLMFETNNIEEGWNGQTKAGIDASEGTYFMILYYSVNNLDIISETSHITLTR